MSRFFKGVEEKPFHYPAIIEERKGRTNYFYWIVGVISLAGIGGIAFLIFR